MPQLSDAAFADTLERLYTAVTEPSAWPDALLAISAAFDAPRMAIMRTTPAMDALFEIRQLNHDPAVEQQYRDYYWAMDPSHRLTRNAAIGQWLNMPALFDPRTTPEPEYMEFAVRNGIRYVAGAKLLGDESSAVVLGLQRPRDHSEFGEDAASVFRRLARHLGRAANISWDLQSAQLAAGLSNAALDTLNFPVFAVEPSGRLLLTNRRGDEHLRTRALLALEGTRLTATSRDLEQRLNASLLQAAGRRAEGFSVHTHQGTWLLRILPVAGCVGTVLVYLGRSNGACLEAAALRQCFGLSQAEAEIASALAAGERPKVIAMRRNVAESTVRSQVRSIFEKTGARNVADLGGLLRSVPPVT